MDTTIYKNISVSKLKDVPEVNSKLPTHTLTIADKDFQNKKVAGKLWTKEGQYGKFLSGIMSDDWKNKEGVNISGYSIISNKYLEFLLKNQSEIKGQGLELEDDINLEDVPF